MVPFLILSPGTNGRRTASPSAHARHLQWMPSPDGEFCRWKSLTPAETTRTRVYSFEARIVLMSGDV